MTALRQGAFALALQLLWTITVDFEDPGQAQAYYAAAEPVITGVLAIVASDMAGFRLKAEAVAWCCASRTNFALGETAGERMIASLLRDLLATPWPGAAAD